MAFCTVNGAPVLAGSISLPRVGVFTVDVELPAPADHSTTLTGAAALQLGTALSLSGTFARSGLDGRGRIRCRIVGGKGGLGKTLSPRSYLGVPMRIPLTDILNDAGEKLSSTADPTILAFQMPAWSRMSAIAGVSLAALVAAAGANWRVLTDGTLWVGTESWPPSTMQAVAVSYEPEAKRRTFASISPTVLPGQTYGGEHVVFVQHLITSRTLRTVLQLE
jgi:hypothetical protein